MKKQFAGIEADFKWKQQRNDVIELQIGVEQSKQTMNTVFKLYQDTFVYHPEGFQTNSSFEIVDIYAKSKYKWYWKSLSVSSLLDVHQMHNQMSSYQSQKKHTPFYINPSVNFSWVIDTNQSLKGSYYLDYSNMDFKEVNYTCLLTSSHSFSKGLGEFKLSDSQRANIGYSIRHYLNRYRISFDLN